MTIWVVRHGSAGRKKQWVGDDDRRPLDLLGRWQAEAVADVLAPREPGRLLASPADRCVQTLDPLADRCGGEVVPAAGLGMKERSGGDLLSFLADEARPGDVVCTHGEVMRPVLAELRHRAAVVTPADDDELLAKGAVWEVDLTVPSLILLRPPPGAET